MKTTAILMGLCLVVLGYLCVRELRVDVRPVPLSVAPVKLVQSAQPVVSHNPARPSVAQPQPLPALPPVHLRAGGDVDEELSRKSGDGAGARMYYEWLLGFYRGLVTCAQPGIKAKTKVLYWLTVTVDDAGTALVVYEPEGRSEMREEWMSDWAPAELELFDTCARDYVEGSPTFQAHLSWAGSIRELALATAFPIWDSTASPPYQASVYRYAAQ